MRLHRIAPLLALGALLPACTAHEDTPRPRHVLLLVADTLRGDRLGCYGYERPTSPEIDALAARGTLYEHCYSQGCWTVPSMISMMTGVAVAQRESNLPAELVVLGEALRAHGLDTAAFPANGVLVSDRGFDRGFAHFDRQCDNRDAVTVYERWKAWYDERRADPARRDQPFFSWVQFIDPHAPYAPAPEHDVFRGERADQAVLLERWTATQPEVAARSAADGRHLVALDRAVERMTEVSNLYDGEVRAVSDGVGRILAALAESGELDDTLVIFCADHGEMLYEHRQEPLLVDSMLDVHEARTASVEDFFGVGHRPWYYEPLWNTPLILAGPGIPAGRRVGGLAANLDLYPTVLEALDLAPVPGLQGQSLFRGREPERDVVFAYGHQSTALRQLDGDKFWRHPNKLHNLPEDAPAPVVLYDLGEDPLEVHDLSTERADETARLRAELDAWHRENARDVVFQQTAAQRRALERLGYVGPEHEDAPAAGGQDAKDGQE
ncbi:MAG: sulfatase-like hydrolase/transferase [Planctomycetes bacterium]|nr:sulfatase-like hydrolase/transferase [Planctomycetota bacterium]